VKGFEFHPTKVAVKFMLSTMVACSLGNAVVPLMPAFAIETLTALDVLQSDIEPKLSILKDILFTLKLYPEYINSKDYASLRSGVRQQPAMDLRKTCKKLKPFLPAGQQAIYEDAYNTLIDSFETMDVVSSKYSVTD
jgi:hypothetical protein